VSVSGVTKSARKRLLWLSALIITIAGLVGIGVATGSGASLTPKLALDLEGGTSIILSPVVEEGATVTDQQLQQAVGIIRQRVDSTGVSEAQISTSGNNNIVVSIPGTPDDNTLKLIRSSAKLEFRSVIATNTSASATVGDDGSSSSPSASAKANSGVTPTDNSDTNWITSELQAQFDALDCTRWMTQVQHWSPVTLMVTQSTSLVLSKSQVQTSPMQPMEPPPPRQAHRPILGR
jgi:preprotein translocase subunit SecD